MLWRRSQICREDTRVARYVTIDSSPQGGYDYFMVYESVITRSEMRPLERPEPLGGFAWGTRMMPVTCLGGRDTSTVHKVCKLIHSAALESGRHFSSWRDQVVGFLSDQGTERKVATAPLLSTDDVSVREAIRMLEEGLVTWDAPAVGHTQFLPRALEHAGHKHIFFNALKEAVTTQKEYEPWNKCLHELLALLGKTENRTRFQARCMGVGAATREEKTTMNRINSSSID